MFNSDNETPGLTEVLSQFVERRLLDVHTSMPGIVQKYDSEKKTVDVRPAIKRKLVNPKEGQDPFVELDLLEGVPVGFYQSNEFIFSFPLNKGDEVDLIFKERSIDKWRKAGGIVNPDDERKFDLSDVVAYPTLKHIGSGLSPDGEHALIQHGSSKIRLSKDGKLEFQGASDELIDLCKQLAEACAAILTNTQLGPQAPVNKGDFTALAGKFGGIKI